MSQEFGGALPTEIFAEQARLPAGFLEQVVEYRVFESVYLAVKNATTTESKQALMGDPLARLAEEIEFEIAQEDMTEEHG